MTYRLAVDVGGTFTDLVLYDPQTNRLEFGKTPSTPADQSVGVTHGIRELIEGLELSARDISYFIHGTTVATNTLLQRSGARTALIVTQGFRDILQIGRQDRPHLYNWRTRRPEPLVPRRLRFEVRERMLHSGEVLTPLVTADVDALIDDLRRADIEAVAVCLLHSYANPVHEKDIGVALRSALPSVPVSLSHEILPEFKEFERMSTTTVNSYVTPVMGRYLGSLMSAIGDLGIKSDLHLMQSNGGTTSALSAIERPVHTVMSGPAAGVIGSVALAAVAGEPNTISMDMGGTSFDVCLCYQGEVRRTQESEIDRLPIKVPMVDVHTLGAGGGSVAWIDPGGALRVGPQSAGADPGPACYARGGTHATVTDANLALARLNAHGFLGGRITLEVKRSREAIRTNIAEPLGLSVEEAAEGIIRVVNATMIKGIRVVSVAKGYDPREFSLVAFGGAGPLHAGELASELAIPRVLVPVAPGVTSALGLLMADLRHDYVRTILKRGDSLAPRELDAIYRELEAEAVAQLRREGAEDNNIGLTRLADVRYMGQGYELEVTVDDGEMGPDELRQVFERFHETHSRHYGYATRDNPVEVVNLRVVALAMMPRPELSPRSMNGAADPPNARTGQRQVYFSGRRLPTHVYDRSRLQPGDAIAGPAIVEQLDSTTVVWPGQVAGVDAFSNLVLERASQ